MSRAAKAVPLALALGWLALWLATLPWGDFPLNDDWTYAVAVQSLLHDGRLITLPWSSVNAVAQIYWGALFCKLFGFSYETLRASTALLGALGVVATYGLLRELAVDIGLAALGALAVGCNPLYLSQSVTFMTDVPFAAMVIVSLFLFARSLRRRSRLECLAAYATGLLAVLVRQFAVVLPVAFAAAWLRRRRLSLWLAPMLVLSVLLFAALHIGFQKWMVATQRTSGFETPVSALLHIDVRQAIQRWRVGALPAIGLIGMSLWPLALLDPARFWPATRWRRIASRLAALALSAALLAAFYLRHAIPPLPGNVIEPFGIGPLTLSDTFTFHLHLPSFPASDPFWIAITLAACWGAAITALALIKTTAQLLSGRREGTVFQGQAAAIAGFIASYGAALIAFLAISQLFDRYLIPLLAPLVVLIAAASPNRPRTTLLGAGTMVAAMAVFSVAATHDWLSWHRSRWDAVHYLQAQSIPATKIDGGYEFNGLTTYRPVVPSASGKLGWWVVDNEYTLAGGPIQGFRQIAAFQVKSWLWRNETQIVVLRREN